MARTVIVAPALVAADSAEITVAGSTGITVGVYVAAGVLPDTGQLAEVLAVTPGAPAHVLTLGGALQSVALRGPATYIVRRFAHPNVAVGVYSET